jgi:hypothetical protein
MINQLKAGINSVISFNGRKGKITLTEIDVQSTVSPLNFIVGDGVKKITASTIAPTSPEEGDIWIDTSTS